jgi:two-component system, OmpR family, KDP operon response regulator KdpE
MQLRVLLVEDDRELRQTLQGALQVEGYDMTVSGNMADAMTVLRQHALLPSSQQLDILIVDLGLPDGDGSELLNWTRQHFALPILIISARHDEWNIVGLLDAGADDYLVKPFSISELLARIRVALRHRGTTAVAAITQYKDGEIDINLPRHEVLLQGQAVKLTPTEFKLLARLVRSTGQVVTHRQLLLDVWGDEFVEHTHYLRVYMAQLRNKLEDNPTEPKRLLTVPGVGYRLGEST